MKKHFTLNEAVEQITQWRESKKGARGRIPEYCWRHAVHLSEEYTAKFVANKMGLKLSDLEIKIKNLNHPLNHTKKSVKKASGFIQIPESMLDSGHPPQNQTLSQETKYKDKCILELDLNNGMKVRIFG